MLLEGPAFFSPLRKTTPLANHFNGQSVSQVNLCPKQISACSQRQLIIQLLIGQKVPVGVQGQLDALMPHPRLQALQIDPLGNPRTSGGMTQRMKPIFMAQNRIAIIIHDRLTRFCYFSNSKPSLYLERVEYPAKDITMPHGRTNARRERQS